MFQMSEKLLKPVYECRAARFVLQDCEAALHELRQNPKGQLWRLRWILAVTLLRTVREALTNIDAKSPEVRPEPQTLVGGFFGRMKATKPLPAIYWEIICEEPNNLLHYYETVAWQRTPGPAPVYEIIAGSFVGRDPRDVLQEAIDWWQNELDELELRAAAIEFEARL